MGFEEAVPPVPQRIDELNERIRNQGLSSLSAEEKAELRELHSPRRA